MQAPTAPNAAAADAPAQEMPTTARNGCFMAATAFGANGRFGVADDVALQRCANVATTDFCVPLASLVERLRDTIATKYSEYLDLRWN